MIWIRLALGFLAALATLFGSTPGLAASARLSAIECTIHGYDETVGPAVASTTAIGDCVVALRAKTISIDLRNANDARHTRVPRIAALQFTGKERDAESGLDWFGTRYMSSAQGRFTSPDKPFADQTPLDPQSWNLYSYTRNNPLKYVDKTGEAIETAWDVLNIGLGVKSFVDNVRSGNYGSAAIDAVGVVVDSAAAVVPFVPGGAGAVIKGARLAGRVDDVVDGVKTLNRVDDAADTAKVGKQGGKTFDEARREGFEKAGMTNPNDVKFTRVDPKTGTVVEFKGPGGAKVAYDGPHATPGPGHNSPHVGYQSAGKRTQGGTQRGNIPYTGPQHPSRPIKKYEGDVEPH